MQKKCNTCNTIKNLSEFYKATRNRDGHTTQCMQCLTNIRHSKKEYMVEYARYNRSKNREAINEKKRQEWRDKNPIKKMYIQAKNRAKTHNIDFNIGLSDIVLPEVCPYLEVPFKLGRREDYQYTYSLDRIDNSKGYVKGNIQVISVKANRMKNSASVEELIIFSRNVIKNNDIVRAYAEA